MTVNEMCGQLVAHGRTRRGVEFAHYCKQPTGHAGACVMNADADSREERAVRLIAADRTLDQYAAMTVAELVDMPDVRLACVLQALATMRPEAAGDVFIPPPARTGPVGELPIRMVTLNDARLLASAVRGYITLCDALRDVAQTTPLDADVRDRLERVVLELDAP